MKKYSLIAFLFFTLAISSCTTKDNSNTTPLPQTIVTSDSSDATGRLYVTTYNATGSSVYTNVQVKLFITYDDLQHNIPLNTIVSDASGRADFGYVLKGNYYITGTYNSGIIYRDTTVAQILPQKSATRYLYLR